MKIAVTGTIGSGKTTVINYISSMGYNTFDCDKYVHLLLTKKEVKEEVSQYFDCIVNGEVNRKILGEIVFNNKIKLDKLNSIIHPLVKKQIETLSECTFVEIPLLFESNMEYLFDIIICVYSDDDIVVNRLKIRNDMEKDEANKRMSLQFDKTIKKSKSNYVIINNDTLQCLYEKIDVILGRIKC
ncbi:MAG: dephospho-CoA kinase [Bacilli bacterium]